MDTFMNAVREMRLAQRVVRVPARDDPAARRAKKLEHVVDGIIFRREIERIKYKLLNESEE